MTSSLPPRPPRPNPGLGTILGAVALIVALVAVALPFTGLTPHGAAGPAGATGNPSGVWWAVVNESGTLSRSLGAQSAQSTGTGTYVVTFQQDVSACAVVGAMGLNGSYAEESPGTLVVAGVAGHSNEVAVSTYDASGAADSLAFHVIAACGPGNWAVVSSTGALVHGSGTLSANALHTNGTYQVNFTEQVNNCSFLASTGGSGGVTGIIGSVTVADRAGSQSAVYLAVWDLAGGLSRSGFSLVVVCASPTWAVVASSGSVARGSVSSTSLASTGAYVVNFGQDVQNCAWIVTLGTTAAGSSPPGFISSVGRLGSPDSLWITTWNVTANSTDASFHVAAFC